MEILKIENLTKVYGSGENEVRALDGVSFSVEKGEFLAIIGPSGSGKSTLLHILGAVDHPTEGKVFYKNTDLFSMNEKQLAVFRRRNIGFVFQFYNLVPVLTVEENIELPVLTDNQKPDKAYISELIDFLGLGDRRKHLPSQLSGGQQQRVSIGRALANKPSVILADEPTGNLDSRNGQEIMALLKNCVKKYNQTLIMITHDVSLASKADRVVYMEDGQLSEVRA
jgi:putative ABC transport system ATP-binding protein